MNYEEFLKLIQTRQACRDFNDKPLDKETVLKIARTAMLAPSACNSQPWRMYVVTEPEKLKEVTMEQNKYGSLCKKTGIIIGLIAFVIAV